MSDVKKICLSTTLRYQFDNQPHNSGSVRLYLLMHVFLSGSFAEEGKIQMSHDKESCELLTRVVL